MEWHINAGQGNGGKSTLKFDITFVCLLFLSFIIARLDNVGKHLLDLLERELLGQLTQNKVNRK